VLGSHNFFLTQVCRACDINPADVVYVEAHGTGTVVGDAQELMAIDRLYGSGAGRTAEDPLLIGSVKSNMGHCEGASGMAGVAFSQIHCSPSLMGPSKEDAGNQGATVL
jgi:acyl transferase domain-containing protein